MRLCDIFLGLGEEPFSQLLRSISLGKLKTYQLFDRLKTRLRVTKLNTETLRKIAPKSWERFSQPDGEDFATELGQAILVSNLDMIKAVLDELGIPHEDGFFPKDMDSSKYLSEGWQAKVLSRFKTTYPESLLLFYINHLGWEMGKATVVYLPHTAEANAGPA